MNVTEDKELAIRFIPGLTEEEYIFIIVLILIGVLVRLVVEILNIPIPYHFFLLLIGGGIGIGSLHYNWIKSYITLAYTKPSQILFLYLPTLTFSTTFKMDSHTFMRSMSQVFIIALPVQLIHAVITGFSFMFIIPNEWTFYDGIFFGALCIPIYAMNLPHCLSKLNESRYVSVLLRGEASFGNSTTIFFLLCLVLVASKQLTTWYQVVLSMVHLIIGGIIVGVIVGKVLCAIFNIFYDDLLSIMALSLVIVLIGFYTSLILRFSGIITIAIAGVIANSGRTTLSTEMEHHLLQFWKLVSISTDSVILPITAISVVEYVYDKVTLTNGAFMIVAYVITTLSRFLSLFFAAPILLRLGYGFSFGVLNVVAWGGLKGVLPILLCLYENKQTIEDDVLHQFIMYISALVLLTMLINAPTLAALLRFLGLTELSLAKKANMNSCMRYLRNQRDRAITTLKLNRFFADANWPIVHQVTILRHPYQKQMIDEKEESEYSVYRKGTCPECKREVPNDPTPKEMIDLTREARLRILKARKISYSRQFEAGTLSKESTRLLNQSIEAAVDTPEALIPIDFYVKLFRKENEKIVLQPRKRFRRFCNVIARSHLFEYFICFCVLLNFILVIVELVLSTSNTQLSMIFKILNSMFFLIYFLEFIIKVLGYSTISIVHDGLKHYFSSHWNRFDFSILLVFLIDLMFDILDTIIDEFNKSQTMASTITMIIKLLRILRLFRLLRLCQSTYPQLMKYFNSRIDAHLSFAYDVGKGFATAEREVYDMLTHMIDNKIVREECRKQINKNKLIIIAELASIQKERPWIAITVKTRQAIRSVLNTLRDAIWELKVFGWVDDTEYLKLQSSLNLRMHNLKNSMKSVQPNSPKTLFSEVAWMDDDENIIEYLYENVATKIYDQGEVIYKEGEMSLLHVSYEPNEQVLENVSKYGMLPIIDNISTVRFDESYEDYILAGNSLGELSMLTNRSYNCSVIATKSTQAYVLQQHVIKEAFARNPDPITGLEARIWKYISVRLAASLLMDTPAYQSAGYEKIYQQLDRAFIPNISNHKMFALNDLMEDVMLIEGVAMDYNTRDYYIAPCYLPRTVEKLLLPKSSNMKLQTDIETKLLIIPVKDTDEIEIMLKENETSELVSVTSSKCLQHLIQMRNKRKRKQQGMFGIGPKTKRYNGGETKSIYTTAKSFEDEKPSQADQTNMRKNNRQDSKTSQEEQEIGGHGYS